MAPAGVMAQKVYKQGSGNNTQVVLDMTEEAGMPAGSMTATKKYTGTYSPSNTGWLINATENTADGPINATVYQKLEIAPLFVSSATANTLGDWVHMNWAQAFQRCKGISVNGRGNWRLPTQREAYMIWLFVPALNEIFIGMGNSAATALPFTNINYWTANEGHDNNSRAWTVNINLDGYGQTTLKTNARPARCVREL